MRSNPVLSSWHPATKALVGVALVALPYLAWTSLGEAPAAVAVAVAPRAASAETPAAVPSGPAEAPSLRQLPPIDRFSVMLERPLFSASRRPLVVAGLEPEAGPEENAEEQVPVDAAADGAPPVRFVGTIGQHGAMSALVLRGDQPAVERLVVGDEIDGWRVTGVTASELVMQHDAERLVLTILQ
jgi:hypothetical protein